MCIFFIYMSLEWWLLLIHKTQIKKMLKPNCVKTAVQRIMLSKAITWKNERRPPCVWFTKHFFAANQVTAIYIMDM